VNGPDRPGQGQESIIELMQLSTRLLEILALPALSQFPGNSEATAALARLQAHGGQFSWGIKQRGLAVWQLEVVKAHMIERLDQPSSLQELAGLVKLSRWHFCTAFHLAAGQTPREWMIDQRMRKARNLLLETDSSITDIALAVGYRSASAFTVQFRRTVGMAPTDYRRRR